MKRSVGDLIRQKGLKTFCSASREHSIFEALAILHKNQSSALLVVEDGKLHGIFSEKDFTRACITKGIPLYAKVDSVMTARVYYVDPTFTVEQCLQIMSKVHVRHLPVLENGTPIALISMRHIMEVLVEDKEMLIRDLTSYITGCSMVELLPNQITQTTVPVLYGNAREGVI